MAMHFLNHCDKRYAFPEAFLLFHEAKNQVGPTARQAKHAAEQMNILTHLLEMELIYNLGTDQATFDYHNVNETLWTGYSFWKAFPHFDLKLVRDVKMPADYDKSIYATKP
jgi:hypothetical protein